MRKQETAPRWGVVYLLFVGALGLLWLERRSAMTPFDHTVALLGIVVAFFVLMSVLLSAGT